MKQEIVIGISLSTAIYVQIFFIKNGYYPIIYIEKGKKDHYFPNSVNPDLFLFLKKIIPGIEGQFGEAHWTYLNSQLTQQKYVSLPGISEFLYNFFHSKGVVMDYSQFTYAINSNNVAEIEFLLTDNVRVFHEYPSITTYQGNILSRIQHKIAFGKICEIFSFDISYFSGSNNSIYEHRDVKENMFYLVGSIGNKLYLSIDYSEGEREGAIDRFFELFREHLNPTFTRDMLSSEQGYRIDLMVNMSSPIVSNVRLLGNALGYLPPTHNFGLSFSVFDAYNTVYYSYKEVFLYRTKLYQLLKYIYKRDGKIEKDPILDAFIANNTHFSLFSIEKVLRV